MNPAVSFFLVCLGFILGATFAGAMMDSVYTPATIALHECELDLPRDQECTLMAVPPPKFGEFGGQIMEWR